MENKDIFGSNVDNALKNEGNSKLTFLFDVNQKQKVEVRPLHEPVAQNFETREKTDPKEPEIKEEVKKEKKVKIKKQKNKEKVQTKTIDKKSRLKSFGKFLKVFFIVVFSPVILLYLIIRAIVKKVKFNKWEREGKRGKLLLLSSDISQIDIMEGYEFEEYLKTLFFYIGYNVEATNKAKDYGADLILTDDKEKVVVQAKRYNKTVGIKSVQEVLGAKKHYEADQCVVVTNSKFSFEAETLAKENAVRLIDREELIELYKEVKERLKLSTKESELVAKESRDITDKFPHMI